jgi:PEGA domain
VPSRKKAWIVAAAASLVLLVSSVFAFGILPLGKSSKEAASKDAARSNAVAPETAATDVPTGELRIESIPDGARVVLDGRESGFTPLTLNNITAGRHLLVLEGENGTVRRTVRVQAGERTIARYEITGGFIAISSKFPVEVYQGTRKIGVSSEGHLSLAPGRQKITLVNGRFNYRVDVELTVKAGEITTHMVELPLGSLLVNTAPGAEIFVDGERMGSAPLGAFPTAVGAREVLVRHVDLGERRHSVDVTPGRQIELSVSFEGAPARQQPKLAPLSMPPARRR